eukprot:TRINITY_DN4551_c0_g1_i1.p1 TRINITY_DN4551_c0_g1~~TRINITY_DN4551_c0_g1_i1.p1  ORF type:complete len:202 (-),score=14.36 TRINITY_DN4551_c0_g1_i1:92-655(-)
MGKTYRREGNRSVSYKSDHSHYSRGGCAERDRTGHHRRRNETRSSMAKDGEDATVAVMNYRLKSSSRETRRGIWWGTEDANTLIGLGGNSDSFAPVELVTAKQLDRRGHIGKFAGHRNKRGSDRRQQAAVLQCDTCKGIVGQVTTKVVQEALTSERKYRGIPGVSIVYVPPGTETERTCTCDDSDSD